jgi:hemolysin activation/secretion protein
VPTTVHDVQYLPVTARWDASRQDPFTLFPSPNRPAQASTLDFGLGYTPNFTGAWFENSRARFQAATGSKEGDGYYHLVNASLGRDQVIYEDWRVTARLDGQWANQPLISNEQYGIGGVAGVRGYREGEILGDTGWRFTFEPKTPIQTIGVVYGKQTLRARGSLFMDYAQSFLLDPQGRPGQSDLWGAGLGGVATIGVNWEAKFILGWPLLPSPTTEQYQPRLNFSLSGQF